MDTVKRGGRKVKDEIFFGTMPQIMLIYGTSLILPNTKETIGLVWGEGNFIIDSCWIMDCRVATKKVSALNSQSLCWNSAIKASPSKRVANDGNGKVLTTLWRLSPGWRWSVAMETECFSPSRRSPVGHADENWCLLTSTLSPWKLSTKNQSPC